MPSRSEEKAAQEALKSYSGWTLTRLLNVSENAIFEVGRLYDHRAVLRIHRQGYQSDAAILSELNWVHYLAENGIRTPQPIANDCGSLITPTPTGLKASMLSWVNGISLENFYNFHAGNRELLGSIYFKAGAEIARIHNTSDSYSLPSDFTRSSWDVEGFLGDKPLWGQFWNNPDLTPARKRLVLHLREYFCDVLTRHLADQADYGLIHADTIRSNIMMDHNEPVIIDFDDCGFGFRLYDLALLLSKSYGNSEFEFLGQCVMDGYRQFRPLGPDSWNQILQFILLRNLILLGWVVPRLDSETIATKTQGYLATIDSLLEELELTHLMPKGGIPD